MPTGDLNINELEPGKLPSSSGVNESGSTPSSYNIVVPSDFFETFKQPEELVPDIGQPVFSGPFIEDVENDFDINSITGESPTRINTILNCFVDSNLELNPNIDWEFKLLDVSFSSDVYNTEEGLNFQIEISLSQPSTTGFEEVEIELLPNGSANFYSDIVPFGQGFEGFPIEVKWELGQQVKIINFTALSDAFLEGVEFFELGITNLKNVNPGNILETRINIEDDFEPKTVKFETSGGNVSTFTTTILGNPVTLSTLSFEVQEGGFLDISLSLNEPSEFGTESVEVLIQNLSTSPGDAEIVSPQNQVVSWSAGEQVKTFTVKAYVDEFQDPGENLKLILQNPQNVLITSSQSEYSEAFVSILDTPPQKLYFKVNFPSFYVQRGNPGVGSSREAQTRFASSSTSVYSYGTSGSDGNRWAIKFGEPIQAPVNTGPTPGLNGYSQTILNNTTNYYFFGIDPRDGTTGDLKLKITNTGDFSVTIEGQIVDVNDSITVDVTNENFELLLETNYAFIQPGTQGVDPNLYGFLEKGSYEFEFYVQYSEHDFILKNELNQASLDKTINIGNFSYFEGVSLSDALNNLSVYSLKTTYRNMRTRKFSTLGIGGIPTCNTNFSDGASDSVRNIKIDGIYFLNETPQSNQTIEKTEYLNFSFLINDVDCQTDGCCSSFGNDGSLLSESLSYTTISFDENIV
jgi:hypothetical protein